VWDRISWKRSCSGSGRALQGRHEVDPDQAVAKKALALFIAVNGECVVQGNPSRLAGQPAGCLVGAQPGRQAGRQIILALARGKQRT
jgi:hypothetical protein